jgi:hypothetical protein
MARYSSAHARLTLNRKQGYLLFLAIFFCAAMAAGQDQPTNNDSPSGITLLSSVPLSSTPLSHTKSGSSATVFAGHAPLPWQFTIGYQFNRLNIRGAFPPFSTNGADASLVRYFRGTLGVEADVGGAFGRTANQASVGAIFVGAGLHAVLINRTRFEPWAHGLLGGTNLNFGAPESARAGSVAWLAGGGVDYRFNPKLAVRIQGDYLGTHFLGAFQRNLQIVSGVVWNF